MTLTDNNNTNTNHDARAYDIISASYTSLHSTHRTTSTNASTTVRYAKHNDNEYEWEHNLGSYA